MSDKPQAKTASSTVPVQQRGIEKEIFAVVVLFLVFSGGAGLSLGFLGGGDFFLDILRKIHSFLTTVATIVAMLALIVIIYSFMRISEISARETAKLGLALNWNSEKKQKNERWHRVEEYMSSLNPSDWKIAILEADNILEQVVDRMGYDGVSLGERLKKIEASDFPYLEEAWTAHKTRNSIAHKGTDYPLNRSEAEQTINIYHRIFKELGYL